MANTTTTTPTTTTPTTTTTTTTINSFVAEATWEELAQLSWMMTNASNPWDLGVMRAGVVYMATCPMVGTVREWSASGEVDHIDDGFGGWLGFAEPGVRRFYWQSGTSGASIEATRGEEGDPWIVRFTGCSLPQGRESYYFVHFMWAVDPESLVVERLRDISELREVVDLNGIEHKLFWLVLENQL